MQISAFSLVTHFGRYHSNLIVSLANSNCFVKDLIMACGLLEKSAVTRMADLSARLNHGDWPLLTIFGAVWFFLSLLFLCPPFS
jgi:hypothetical protein